MSLYLDLKNLNMQKLERELFWLEEIKEIEVGNVKDIWNVGC